MASVSSISSRAIGAITKTKPVKSLCNWFRKDPEKALAYSTIGSVVIKDGVGCAMYVYQSLNNKKIPDDKRKFVASLDLTNGVLMIASQIAMFFVMRKMNKKLFAKLFKNSFDDAGKAFKSAAEQMRMDQKKTGLQPDKKPKLRQDYEKLKKDTFDVFKFVTELGAATIIGKRVIVPFIATPLASVVEKKMNAKDASKKVNSEEKPDNSNPTMTGKTTQVKEEEEEKPAKLDINDGNTNLLAKYRK